MTIEDAAVALLRDHADNGEKLEALKLLFNHAQRYEHLRAIGVKDKGISPTTVWGAELDAAVDAAMKGGDR